MSFPDSAREAAARLITCVDALQQEHMIDEPLAEELVDRLEAVSTTPESAAAACELIWQHRELLVRPLVQRGQLAVSRLRLSAGEAWTALPTTLRAVAGAINTGYAGGWAAMDGQRLWLPDHLIHHAMLDLEVGHNGLWPHCTTDPDTQDEAGNSVYEAGGTFAFRVWQERVLTELNGGERPERAWIHQPGAAWIQPGVALQRAALEAKPGGLDLWTIGSREAALSAAVALPTDRPWWTAGWPAEMPRRALQWMEHAQAHPNRLGSWQPTLCPAPDTSPFGSQAMLWLEDPTRTPGQAVAEAALDMVTDDPGDYQRNDGDWWLFMLPMPFSAEAPLWMDAAERPAIQLDTMAALLAERQQVPSWQHVQRGQVCMGCDLLRWGLGHLVLSGAGCLWTEPGNRYLGDWWFSLPSDEPPPTLNGQARCRPVPTEVILRNMVTPSPCEHYGDGFTLDQPAAAE